MPGTKLPLATNQTTNAAGDAITHGGARLQIDVEAVAFDGATVTIQGRPTSSYTYKSLGTDAVFTAAGTVIIEYAGQIRSNITGGAESSQDITVTAYPVGIYPGTDATTNS
jgi:Flp pilus assembly CpaF family ATPase